MDLAHNTIALAEARPTEVDGGERGAAALEAREPDSGPSSAAREPRVSR